MFLPGDLGQLLRFVIYTSFVTYFASSDCALNLVYFCVVQEQISGAHVADETDSFEEALRTDASSHPANTPPDLGSSQPSTMSI